MLSLQQINQLIAQNSLKEALELLDRAISEDENCEELYFLRGKVNWRIGKRGAAITDYEHAVALNPDSKAKVALKIAHEVNEFYNPDLLNP